jgi:hypothetical protein
VQPVLPFSSDKVADLQKSGGLTGLYAVVAYELEDPAKKLVIFVQMPQESGTKTLARVGRIWEHGSV